jgi:hypothetical protein
LKTLKRVNKLECVFLHHKFYWKLQRLNKMKECMFLHIEIKEIEESKEFGSCEQTMWYVCDEHVFSKKWCFFFNLINKLIMKQMNNHSPLSFFLSSENGWSFFSIQQMNKRWKFLFSNWQTKGPLLMGVFFSIH